MDSLNFCWCNTSDTPHSFWTKHALDETRIVRNILRKTRIVVCCGGQAARLAILAGSARLGGRSGAAGGGSPSPSASAGQLGGVARPAHGLREPPRAATDTCTYRIALAPTRTRRTPHWFSWQAGPRRRGTAGRRVSLSRRHGQGMCATVT